MCFNGLRVTGNDLIILGDQGFKIQKCYIGSPSMWTLTLLLKLFLKLINAKLLPDFTSFHANLGPQTGNYFVEIILN